MNIAVVFAGGVGKRMKTKDGTPKQFLKINGEPILIHTLSKFEESPDIDAIVLSCLEDYIEYSYKLIKQYNITKIRKIVKGGATGQLSIYNGLRGAKEISNSEDDIVLIHDGVRPIIDSDLIRRNIECVKMNGSSISSVAQHETTIMVDDKKNSVEKITERSKTYIARAPQCFYLKDILEAHEKAISEERYDFTDSASIMLNYGKNLFITECSPDNLKVTTPNDYYVVKALIDAKEDSKVFGIDEKGE